MKNPPEEIVLEYKNAIHELLGTVDQGETGTILCYVNHIREIPEIIRELHILLNFSEWIGGMSVQKMGYNLYKINEKIVRFVSHEIDLNQEYFKDDFNYVSFL